jgi:hypothetical protein
LKRASIACAWKDTKATAPTIQFKKLLRIIHLYVEKNSLQVLCDTHVKNSSLKIQLNGQIRPLELSPDLAASTT